MLWGNYALLVTVASFAAIIVLVKVGADLGLSLFAGALMLSVLLATPKTPAILASTISDVRTLYLMLMSFSVSLFAVIYEASGVVRELGAGLARALRSPAAAIMLVPAIVGLLPVAGGALMSAPIIRGVGGSAGLNAAELIFANVWFRHILFLIYPLSQVMIATSAMTGEPIELIAAIQAPILAFAIIIGYLMIRDGLRRGCPHAHVGGLEVRVPLKYSLTPLVVAVPLALTLRYALGLFGTPLGVLASVPVILAAMRKAGLGGNATEILWRGLRSGRVWGITATAYAIMFLQHATVGSGASRAIAAALSSVRAPSALLCVAIPATIAFLTSSPLSSVVLTLPMIPSASSNPSLVSLVYVSALITYIGSPTHLCLVYTSKYFGPESLTKSYRYLVPATVATLAFAIAYLMLIPAGWTRG